MGNKEINCSYTREITCPYCGVEHTDSWEYMDDGEINCEMRKDGNVECLNILK